MHDAETVRMHVAQALSRAVHPDAKRHLRAALDRLDPAAPTPLEACPLCGAIGLPERIDAHDCSTGA